MYHRYLDTSGSHRVVQLPHQTHCLSIPCTTVTWTLRVRTGSSNSPSNPSSEYPVYLSYLYSPGTYRVFQLPNHCLSIPCTTVTWTLRVHTRSSNSPSNPPSEYSVYLGYLYSPGTHRVVQLPTQTHHLSIPCTTVIWTLLVQWSPS